MNYKLLNYEIPSTTIFFEGKVQRNVGIIYGLNVNSENYASIIKVPAGTYIDNKFTSFFNFKSHDQIDMFPFENNYPESNSYKEQCTLYAIKNDDIKDSELKWSPLLCGWTTDENLCVWMFTSGYAEEVSKQYITSEQSRSITNKQFKIKDLLNNGVFFKHYIGYDRTTFNNVFKDLVSGVNTNFITKTCYQTNISATIKTIIGTTSGLSEGAISGILSSTFDVVNNTVIPGAKEFIFDDIPNYVNPLPPYFSIPNIEYTELSAVLTSGISFYDAVVQNNIGYVYGLEIKDNTANIIKVPAVRFYDYKEWNTRELFRFNDVDGETFFANFYPQHKSYLTKCNLYYIAKGPNYYNTNTKSWTTNLTNTSLFFTEANAKRIIEMLVLQGAEVKSLQISIKYLTNDACINFPVYSHQRNNY